MRERLPALLALAIPVLTGAICMALAGAPSPYPLVNLAALAAGLAWIVYGIAPATALDRRIMAGVLLALLVVPVVTGPVLNSITGDPVARWLPLGPVMLHSGMLTLPALTLLAAREERHGYALLLAALAILLFQPDAASGFALTFAAVGLHHITRDWRMGLVAIIGFFASIGMNLAGELPPEPFVERVLVDAAMTNLALAAILALSLLASFLLIVFAAPLPRPERFGLAGALFGFAITALMTHYPTPLIGYGAAPILGFALALGLHRKPRI